MKATQIILLMIIVLTFGLFFLDRAVQAVNQETKEKSVDSRSTLKNFRLPPQTAKQIKTIIAQDRKQGTSQTIIFAGTDQQGKLAAANDIASTLKRPLVKSNIKTLVSRYIGETEKNIESVFKKAETQGAILLFDEADAIFGKRTEVSDAHDKYANIEISYLLTRLETYKGLAILSTNNRSNIKSLRSLRYQTLIAFPCTPTKHCQ